MVIYLTYMYVLSANGEVIQNISMSLSPFVPIVEPIVLYFFISVPFPAPLSYPSLLPLVYVTLPLPPHRCPPLLSLQISHLLESSPFFQSSSSLVHCLLSLVSLHSVYLFVSLISICDVMKQTESEVGNDMLLVSNYFYTSHTYVNSI